jgi:CubicO group peptidase (beta-lactamase class C family)
MTTTRKGLGAAACGALLVSATTAGAQEMLTTLVSPAVQDLRRHMLDTTVSTPTFQNMDRIFDVRRVGRTGPVNALARADSALPGYSYKGVEYTSAQFMDRTFTNAFLVIREGRIVYEQYRNNSDDRTRFISFSMAKSITSILIGIAIDKGLIHSIEDPVTDYAPELNGTAFDGTTIRDLLEMRSGTDYEERYDFGENPSLAAQVFEKTLVQNVRRFADFARETQRRYEPGEQFNYSTLDTAVLGLVLERAAEQPLATFTQTNLWEPVGMEFDGFWLLDGAPGVGRELNGMGYNAALRDFGRLGLMMLNGGRVGDRQIVSSDWVEQSTRFVPIEEGDVPAPGVGYGFQWWFPERASAFAALGLQGQYIYVDKPSNTVIVKLSHFPPGDDLEVHAETLAFFNAITGGSR